MYTGLTRNVACCIGNVKNARVKQCGRAIWPILGKFIEHVSSILLNHATRLLENTARSRARSAKRNETVTTIQLSSVHRLQNNITRFLDYFLKLFLKR